MKDLTPTEKSLMAEALNLLWHQSNTRLIRESQTLGYTEKKNLEATKSGAQALIVKYFA